MPEPKLTEDPFDIQCPSSCFKCCSSPTFVTKGWVYKIRKKLNLSFKDFFAKHLAWMRVKDLNERCDQLQKITKNDSYLASKIDGRFNEKILNVRLQRKADGSCIFLGEQGCTVYEDRPVACKAYPFSITADQRLLYALPCEGMADNLTEEEILEFQKAKTYDVKEYFKRMGITDQEYLEYSEFTQMGEIVAHKILKYNDAQVKRELRSLYYQ